eukprot:SAG22_NODE_427_length_10603_cov_19.158225_6_plen_315_part_00
MVELMGRGSETPERTLLADLGTALVLLVNRTYAVQPAAARRAALRRLVDEAAIGPVADLALDSNMICDFSLDLASAVAVWALWWTCVFAFPTDNDGSSVQNGDPQDAVRQRHTTENLRRRLSSRAGSAGSDRSLLQRAASPGRRAGRRQACAHDPALRCSRVVTSFLFGPTMSVETTNQLMDSGIIAAHMQLLAELEARDAAAAAAAAGPTSGSRFSASTSALAVLDLFSITAVMMHMAMVSQREHQPKLYQNWGETLLRAGMAEVCLRVMGDVTKLPLRLLCNVEGLQRELQLQARVHVRTHCRRASSAANDA